ncbi:MAG: hypothetical protein ABSE69_16370 [Roseiarcus sp.]
MQFGFRGLVFESAIIGRGEEGAPGLSREAFSDGPVRAIEIEAHLDLRHSAVWLFDFEKFKQLAIAGGEKSTRE